jgi:acetate kinase
MNGTILVVNAGSSSIKLSVFGPWGHEGPERVLSAQVEGLGSQPHAAGKRSTGQVLFDQHWPDGGGPTNHEQALAFLLGGLVEGRGSWQPYAVGHRVVHGGPRFSAPTVIDQDVRRQLEELVPLAPLHQPHNLKGIDAAKAAFPQAVQVACFDTAFHRTHPWVADTYALPRHFYETGVRRYGFHGLSYEYIVRAMLRLAPAVAGGRMVVAHLGNGASLCAIQGGQAVDTTMGFTALDGLPMGTRCGQIDPGLLLHLLMHRGMTPQDLMQLLYFQSGLLGLSAMASDMRGLLDSDKEEAKQTVDYFVYRVMCAIGTMVAALGGIDGLVFTAGIGENASAIRGRVCQGLAWMGLDLDEFANNHGDRHISLGSSRVSAWVVPTDEERMIAIHIAEMGNHV